MVVEIERAARHVHARWAAKPSARLWRNSIDRDRLSQITPLSVGKNMIESPCVSKCSLSHTDICMGCGRSLEEIVSWSSASDEAKSSTLRQASARKSWVKVDGRVRAVAAIGPHGEAGLAGGLPWRMPSELAWFKQATAGMALAVGRTSWEAMSTSLPGRPVAVISTTKPSRMELLGPRGVWLGDWDGARSWAFDQGRNLCVVGGPTLWEYCWPDVDLAWITEVDGPMEHDRVFDVDLEGFEDVALGPGGKDGVWTWRAHLWERLSSK